MIDGIRETDSGKNIVLKLCEKYFGSKRNVTFDNFFNSIKIAIALHLKDLSSLGTLRSNKVNWLDNFY